MGFAHCTALGRITLALSERAPDPLQKSRKKIYSKEERHCNTSNYKVTFASFNFLLKNSDKSGIVRVRILYQNVPPVKTEHSWICV